MNEPTDSGPNHSGPTQHDPIQHDPIPGGAGDDGVVLELTNALDAPATARHFVTEHAAHLSSDLVHDAELLVSEIVTNAIRHGRPTVTLSLRLDPPGIGVSVHDFGDADALPVENTRVPDVAQPGGRGLLIVRAVASDWGVVPSDPPPGKTVWFRLEP